MTRLTRLYRCCCLVAFTFATPPHRMHPHSILIIVDLLFFVSSFHLPSLRSTTTCSISPREVVFLHTVGFVTSINLHIQHIRILSIEKMRLILCFLCTVALTSSTTNALQISGVNWRNGRLLLVDDPAASPNKIGDRRGFLKTFAATTAGISIFGCSQPALAEEETNTYENPNIPAGPEERSGLVVLRVAEVCQFQEKILRAVANGDLPGVTVSPQQIVFGTKILLKNSNIAGNMKLMIADEVPRQRRAEASRNAARTMNTLQTIYSMAEDIRRPFSTKEMIMFADLYRDCRIQLNEMYEYLPQKQKDKYYGYFVAVTEYEKKIADGVYNPDIDGVLKFDE